MSTSEENKARRLERLGEVPSVSPHLPVAQLEDQHQVGYLPAAVVGDPLDDPQALLDQHSAQLDRWRRGGVGLLERPHVLPPPEAPPDRGISIT
jgi:hypothetical protein